MKNMFKVDYQGASLEEKNFIKHMLRMASGVVLECVEEEYCLIFCNKGKVHIQQHLDAKTLQNCKITIDECNKHELNVNEINEFFERMEKAQERFKDVLRSMGTAL
jgi:hypothetical protein